MMNDDDGAEKENEKRNVEVTATATAAVLTERGFGCPPGRECGHGPVCAGDLCRSDACKGSELCVDYVDDGDDDDDDDSDDDGDDDDDKEKRSVEAATMLTERGFECPPDRECGPGPECAGDLCQLDVCKDALICQSEYGSK